MIFSYCSQDRLENERIRFLENLYFKIEKTNLTNKDSLYSYFANYTKNMNSLISIKDSEEFRLLREKYLRSNKKLPVYIKNAIKNRQIAHGMSNYEFNLVLSNRHNNLGNGQFKKYKNNEMLVIDRCAFKVIDGFVKSFGKGAF